MTGPCEQPNRMGELPFQRPGDPSQEQAERVEYEHQQLGGTLVPGAAVPVVRQAPTPGGPDGDATGCP